MTLLKDEVIPGAYADFYNTLTSSAKVPDTFQYVDDVLAEEIEMEEVLPLSLDD